MATAWFCVQQVPLLDKSAVPSTWHGVLSNYDIEGVDVKDLRQFWRHIGELALS